MRLMPRSLRWRLLLLSVLVILPALVLLAWQLSHAFERSVEERVRRELENHLNQLIAHARLDPAGKPHLTTRLSDPRFSVPLSGLYWQVNDANRAILRSRSLWDSVLPVDEKLLRAGGVHEYVLAGPRGEELYVVMRGVWLEPAANATPGASAASTATPGKPKRLLFITAIDHGEISQAVASFNRRLWQSLAALALLLALAFTAQIVWGLKPLAHLRRQLEAVRRGRQRAITRSDIAELDPLIGELNALLLAQEKSLEEARARAGNLAHGMKTPLAVLAARARDLKRHGLAETAADIEEQIRQLTRHVEHELARSKIHGGKGTLVQETPAERPLAGIAQALRPLNERLVWQLEIEEGIAVPMEKGDFMELAGNLMENAAKWANAQARVRCCRDTHGRVCLLVEDDGPGVPQEHYATIMQRGVRLDERVRGSGLGMAIVGDILEAYGYALHFFPSELGGFGVCVIFSNVITAKEEPKTRIPCDDPARPLKRLG